MLSLSVAIITLNESRIIEKTILSVKSVASEVIVLDSGSTDGTINLAKNLGAKCYHQDWLGFSQQKNMCIDKTSGDLVLSLDADEIMSNELVEEIKVLLSQPIESLADGYKIARLLFIDDKPLKFGGFYPDYQLRLFKRGLGKFNDRLVHESIKINGHIKFLKNPLNHYAYTSLNDFKENHEKYAVLAAEYNKEKFYAKFKKPQYYHYFLFYIDYFIHPIWTLFFRFIIRLGFLDGVYGLQANLIYSDYVRKKILYFIQACKLIES